MAKKLEYLPLRHLHPRESCAFRCMYVRLAPVGNNACTMFMLSSSSPVHLVCDAWVEVLWLLCIVYVIRAQPAELPR